PGAFFCSSRRRHTRFSRDWSSDVCSSDLGDRATGGDGGDGPDGAEIYRGNCATCHGGSGQGGVGPGFEGIGDRLTVEEQIEVVREGRGRMPAWEDELSPEEIEAVVAYIDEELSGG